MDNLNVFPEKAIIGTGPVSQAVLAWGSEAFWMPVGTFTNCPTATTRTATI